MTAATILRTGGESKAMTSPAGMLCVQAETQAFAGLLVVVLLLQALGLHEAGTQSSEVWVLLLSTGTPVTQIGGPCR